MSSSPHDALFKSVFSEPVHARAELEPLLPRALAASIDWSTLAVVPGSFVDESLARSESDLLFEVQTRGGRRVRLYLLFEHQSSVDRWMPFRLLRYVVRIWEREAGSGAALLVPVVPVVLHHSETGWTAGTTLGSVLDLDELDPSVLELVPRFRFLLDDVSETTDGDLAGRTGDVVVRLALAALREARRSASAVAVVRRLGGLLRDVLRADDGAAAYLRVLRYLLLVAAPEDPRPFVEAVHAAVGDEGRDMATNLWDVIEEKGRERGRSEGRAEGRREALVDLLEARFGALSGALRARVALLDGPAITAALERLARGAGTTADEILGR